jgi:hypothetical protein
LLDFAAVFVAHSQKDLNVQSNQVMALYRKMIKKFVQALQALEEKEAGQSLPTPTTLTTLNTNTLPSLEEDLRDGALAMEVETAQRQNLMDGLVSPDFVIHSMPHWLASFRLLFYGGYFIFCFVLFCFVLFVCLFVCLFVSFFVCLCVCLFVCWLFLDSICR